MTFVLELKRDTVVLCSLLVQIQDRFRLTTLPMEWWTTIAGRTMWDFQVKNIQTAQFPEFF